MTGLSETQLEHLCQTEQIEETMRLLFALNHWAKARERLFFADRQGLYQVKAATLSRAYAAGLLSAKAYIDGTDGFGADLSLDLAADIATEGFLWRLEELATTPDYAREQTNDYERVVHQLYTRITGQARITIEEVEALEAARVEAYILESLQALEMEARRSGQPIPHHKLTELCIAPSDLLLIQDRRYYDLGDWYSWEELDAADQRKLDPEGLSLVAFDYTSTQAHYVFHLPFRMAQAFVPDAQIALLKRTPWSSRESGEYFGRPITEAESLQQPIADILEELGVDVSAICPRQLSDKEDVIFSQGARYAAWSALEFNDDEDDDDDPFDPFDDIQDLEEMEVYWRQRERLRLSASQRGPDSCPCCALPIDIVPAAARVEHWQQVHPDLDLTISQAGWVLNRVEAKKIFCLHYPPDYRAPHERGYGTRYWKIATLREWVQNEQTKR